MAAGLSDHVWAREELLRYRILPQEAAPPPRRSRPPNVISLARRRRAKARAQATVA